MQSTRKPYNDRVGYFASMRSGPTSSDGRGWVVIYDAAAAGIDTDGCRYAVVCETHSTVSGVQGERLARKTMHAPASFCEACAASDGVHQTEWEG
ncbi:MAG: hypothetical protein JWM27_66 [Gemmatimonadetes bacterium]|nr:hypothetical protein [Gemmatimonadota bacterium]